MNLQRWILVALVTMCVTAQATVRTVNQFGTAAFSTVQAAINAAVTGDTILIAPGTYAENLIVSGKVLNVIGAGWDLSIVSGQYQIGSNTGGSVTEGLYLFTGGQTFVVTQLTADSSTVRRCRIRGGGTTVNLAATRRYFVEDCQITSDANGILISVPTAITATLVVKGCVLSYLSASQGSTIYFNGINGSPVEITNCTFVSVRNPFNLTGSQPVIAINNIFYDWTATPTWGTFLAGSVFDYNASDATAPAIPGSFTNHILLGANDPFVNYDEALNFQDVISDLHLNGGAGGLALTDTGHPLIFDVDATRSDVGAYGGPRPLVDFGIPAFPFVTSLTVPSLIESGDDLHVNSTGRVGPRY
ncbi:MAG: hypothetical protein IPK53_17975 [bacterium]|nr:hypothetical protein [bacterium]